jgi:hypothetical protein
MQSEFELVAEALDTIGSPRQEAEAACMHNMLDALDGRIARRRARHRRVAIRLALAAALLALGAIALADGIGLFDGPPAPPAVKQALRAGASLDGRPAWQSPKILAGKAHELIRTTTPRGDLVLWIAPTRDGNLCLALQHPGEHALSPACIRRGQPRTIVSYAVDGQGGPAPRALWGRVPPGTGQLKLGFEGSNSVQVPLRHGFFLVSLDGRVPTSLTARRADGHVLARQRVYVAPVAAQLLMRPSRADGSPSVTLPHQRRPLLHQQTWAGRLTLWTAPSVFGGPCMWASLEGKTTGVMCEPSLQQALPAEFSFGMNGRNGNPIVELWGRLPAARVAKIRIRFADGRVDEVRAVAGYILYALPPSASLKGHQAVSYALLDHQGRVIDPAFAHDGGMPAQLVEGRDGPRITAEIHRWMRAHPIHR